MPCACNSVSGQGQRGGKGRHKLASLNRKFSSHRGPEITAKAKKLSRDPAKFPERLYPSHKLKHRSEYEKNPTLSNMSNVLSKSPSNSMLQMNDTSTDDITSRVYFKQKEKNSEKKKKNILPSNAHRREERC